MHALQPLFRCPRTLFGGFGTLLSSPDPGFRACFCAGGTGLGGPNSLGSGCDVLAHALQQFLDTLLLLTSLDLDLARTIGSGTHTLDQGRPILR